MEESLQIRILIGFELFCDSITLNITLLLLILNFCEENNQTLRVHSAQTCIHKAKHVSGWLPGNGPNSWSKIISEAMNERVNPQFCAFTHTSLTVGNIHYQPPPSHPPVPPTHLYCTHARPIVISVQRTPLPSLPGNPGYSAMFLWWPLLRNAAVVRVVSFIVHNQLVVDEVEAVRARLVRSVDHLLYWKQKKYNVYADSS